MTLKNFQNMKRKNKNVRQGNMKYIKHESTTKAIRNLGNMLILKFLALSEISCKLKVYPFKIPNYA